MDIEVISGWQQLEQWIRTERIGRRRYIEVNVLSGVIGFIVIFAPLVLFIILPDFDSGFLTVPIAAVGIAVAIIMILIFIATSMARLRDMGRSANWFALGLVPYFNVIFFLVLAMTEGKNAKEKKESS